MRWPSATSFARGRSVAALDPRFLRDRRRRRLQSSERLVNVRLLAQVAAQPSSHEQADTAKGPGPMQDDRLRLIFTCCEPSPHPLSRPRRARGARRLRAVLSVVYLIYTAGFWPSRRGGGLDLRRPRRHHRHRLLGQRVFARFIRDRLLGGQGSLVELLQVAVQRGRPARHSREYCESRTCIHGTVAGANGVAATVAQAVADARSPLRRKRLPTRSPAGSHVWRSSPISWCCWPAIAPGNVTAPDFIIDSGLISTSTRMRTTWLRCSSGVAVRPVRWRMTVAWIPSNSSPALRSRK
jgi:hypothetical protein